MGQNIRVQISARQLSIHAILGVWLKISMLSFFTFEMETKIHTPISKLLKNIKRSNAYNRLRKCVSPGRVHSVLARTESLRPGSASVELLVTRDKLLPNP